MQLPLLGVVALREFHLFDITGVFLHTGPRMPSFLTPDFLLDTPQARRLYHEVAADLPIIDYHSHLDPALVAGHHRFTDPAELWLNGDHYKWRVMRASGVPESCCSGEAPARAKFNAWAATVPRLLRNPLYHWTHLELRRPFGISDRTLSPASADGIWEAMSARLAEPAFTAPGILRQMRVEVLCTTDDPTDSLEHHRAIAADPSIGFQVCPTWRPDPALAIDQSQSWNAWVDRLGKAAGRDIATADDLLVAFSHRHDAFHAAGCRASDHGLETMPGEPATDAEAAVIVAAARAEAVIAPLQAARYQSWLLERLAALDARRGWVQQFHLGALRSVNQRLGAILPPAAGLDTIAAVDYIRPLAAFLARLDAAGILPRTVLYNLNPRENEAMVALCGCFEDGTGVGRMQHGPGWWFLDQLDGMTRQIEALSQLGVLANFIGMTTDSRSFLSFTRHEYFRRLLCRILGRDMAGGMIPDDLGLVGEMVSDISYRNPKRFFNWAST
jgi:glucuronate isomerase